MTVVPTMKMPTSIIPTSNQQMASTTATATTTSSAKLPLKPGRIGPSPFRQLLPVALCLISFATVLSVLIIYMDTTEIRHQQFRLNMSRDYDLLGVSQDNPTLITYLREVHMRKYSNIPFIKNSINEEHLNFTDRHELTPEMSNYIGNLLNNKKNGIFLQSLTGSSDVMMTAPWLAETLEWGGLIVEPDPRKYFNYRKQHFHRPNIQVVHACLSPNGYPKEVTINHDDDSEVKINSILEEETEWFHSRVKCFPLYTIMLAVNKTSIDLLSLGCHGQELQILQTVNFDKVRIEVISIHLVNQDDNYIPHYTQNITKFLLSKGYKLVKTLENNYIYQFNSRHNRVL